MSKQTIIWRICDGKPGHDNQSKALVSAFKGLVDCSEVKIDAYSLKLGLYNFLLKKFPPGAGLPTPDIILAAGHNTHLPLLCSKRACGGKTVLLMKPSLPVSLFDWCIIPSHDRPPDKANIIITKGAPNLLTRSKKLSASNGLILIGGPSKHFYWNTSQLVSQINEIIRTQPHISWKIADSRRTPAEFLARLKPLADEKVMFVDHETTDSDEFVRLYESAGIVWVTQDSVSMIYEALSCGCQVGLLSMPVKKTGKISEESCRLIHDRRVTTFDEWHKTGKMHLNEHELNEAMRCAKLLIDGGILDR